MKQAPRIRIYGHFLRPSNDFFFLEESPSLLPSIPVVWLSCSSGSVGDSVDGDVDGSFVGDADGSSVGDTDGKASVGDDDGSMLGAVEGINEGALDGTAVTVGVMLGMDDGMSVGGNVKCAFGGRQNRFPRRGNARSDLEPS